MKFYKIQIPEIEIKDSIDEVYTDGENFFNVYEIDNVINPIENDLFIGENLQDALTSFGLTKVENTK
jgi:hypothetical protein